MYLEKVQTEKNDLLDIAILIETKNIEYHSD